MSKSYKEINYNLRIAKAIERKMFLELFGRLSVFKKIHDYQYIGFGSTYFNDFILYHKMLGINDMISIESAVDDEARFNFNKPYKNIKMLYGYSHDVLPSIEFNKEAIIWLDYDNHLVKDCLIDLESIATKAKSGTLLLVTTKVNPDTYCQVEDDNDKGIAEKTFELRKSEFIKRLGEEYLPDDLRPSSLNRAGLYKVYRNLIAHKIFSTLDSRNRAQSEEKKVMYEQVINFIYNDGTLMNTVGYIFYEKSDLEKKTECQFESLPFYCNSDNAKRIKVPLLTLKELKYLDTLLPTVDVNDICNNHNPRLPHADIKSYSEVYRYFPTFAEAIV